jgi:HPt (histidine-containing phosphotransfer) domain-containing protein
VRIGELQAALERWGPAKSKKSDTSLLARSKSAQAENMLDQAVISDLRDMPPSNGISMLNELMDLFLASAPQRIAQISQSINDSPMLAFHAHALKSMSLNLGARRMVDISQKLEDLGRTRSVHGAPALLKELENAFTQTKTQLLAARQP